MKKAFPPSVKWSGNDTDCKESTMEVKSTDQVFLQQWFYVLMHISKIVIEISRCLGKWICVTTQMFLQVFYMIPPDTQSLEELLYAFSRLIIQGKIIAPYGFATCSLHAILSYSENPQNLKYYISTSNIKKGLFLGLWEAWKRLVWGKKVIPK